MAHYLITGCNRGIGLELAKQLKVQGHQITGVCRSQCDELHTIATTLISGIDVSKPSSLQIILDNLPSEPIDILINNAGVWGDEKLGDLAVDKFSQILHINAIAPLLVTDALLPHLAKHAKIIMMTSRMGSIADNSSGGRYSYRMSKAALNAASRSLSIDLKAQGIIVGIIHPGWVATDMGGEGGIPVAESVRQVINTIEHYTLETSGTFMHANGTELPW